MPQHASDADLDRLSWHDNTIYGFRFDRSGPLRREIADFSEAEQEAAWDALSEAARAFEAPDGGLCMNNQAYCVAARR